MYFTVPPNGVATSVRTSRRRACPTKRQERWTFTASALQIAVRFPDDGGADEVVAAIGEQILGLGPTDVSLSNWTVRPSGCSVVLATHTAGVSVDGYTLTLRRSRGTLCEPTT